MLEGLSHLFSQNRPAVEILRDFGDLFIVAFIIYRALLVLKGTRAMQMGLGFLVFGALYILAKYAELATLLQVLSWLASSAILILVVVFQNDIRRALIRVGEKAWLARGDNPQERLIEDVVKAATDLARHRTGALICLEQDANVLEFITNDPIKIDAIVSADLLVSLFFPDKQVKTHDGAVIISNLRISRAGVMFPMVETKKLKDSTFGSRHRAAIGITEETDAVVVVVSEERGQISLVAKGEMETNLSGEVLEQRLLDIFGRPVTKKARRLPFRRGRKKTPPLSMKPVSEKVEPKTERKSEATTTIKPSLPPRASVPPASSASPKLADAVKTNKQSGGFRPVRREETTDEIPVAVRVSVPMPSSKDRKSTDTGDRVTLTSDKDSPAPAPTAAQVSKPMTPTELPGTPLPSSPGDDS
jgi:uncharacterized protein (TIGR00159 family)